MSPFRCSLCIQPSIEFPQDFKVVLSDFIRVFNTLVLPCSINCRDVGNLRLCRSCWVYLMRIHTLDEQLSVKNKTSGAKIAKILPKIRAQRSLVENPNDFQQDIQVQILTEENSGVVEDAANILQRQDYGDSSAVDAGGLSSDNSDDDNNSEIESLDSCATDAASKSTENSIEEKNPKENESTGNSGLFESKTVKRKSSASATAYENKWLPFNLTRLQYSPVVKRLSEVDFIYEDKYPFQGTETGFQCGLCPQICAFYKELPIWSNMIGHMKMWHRRGEGNRKVRANKVPHKFTQIAPDRFQYGPYFVDKIGESYRCGKCGAMKSAGPTNKNAYKNIMFHINKKHENPSRTYVCEQCGIVYRNRSGLQAHKHTKHENPNGRFPCSDCGKIFPSHFKASVHKTRVHRKQQAVMCESCGKVFKNKAVLEDHVAFVHNGQKIECKECGKMFASQAALNTHRNSHTGRKYTCDICGMDFPQNYSVTRHKKTAHQQ